MDEIHDMIMQFKTNDNDILKVLNILDKLNDKINNVQYIANKTTNITLATEFDHKQTQEKSS